MMKTDISFIFLLNFVIFNFILGISGVTTKTPTNADWPALGENNQQSVNFVPPPNGWAALSYDSQQASNWPALPGQKGSVEGTNQVSAAIPAPNIPTTTSTTRKPQGNSVPSYAGVAGQGSNVRPPTTRSTTHRTTTRPRTTSRAGTSSSKITDAELATFADNVFKKDNHNHFQHVTINLQGRVPQDNGDAAPNKLLTVNESVVLRSPTVQKLQLLYNNYELDTSVNEYVTPIERSEESDFLDVVLATPVMRYTMQLLQQKGVVTADPKTHKDLLRTIWFNTYSRGQGKIGSSGFEHVFLTEVKNGTLSGLHNWLYFLEEEKQGKLDYKGYSKSVKLGNKGEIVKLRFCRKEICKPTTSMLIGSSPELELALYTACFELRPDADCPLTYAGKTFTIKTHTFKYRGKQLVGSAFIQI